MDDSPTREVRLNRVRSVLADLSYPISPTAAAEELADVRVLYADGGEPLSALLERSGESRFEDVADAEAEAFANAPTEAVGEPGQSEGEG